MVTAIPTPPAYTSPADEADQLVAMGVAEIAGVQNERILQMLDVLVEYGGGAVWSTGAWSVNDLTAGAATAAFNLLGWYDEKADHLLEVMEAEDVGFINVPATVEVPDVVDTPQAEAAIAITAVGLVVGTVTTATHPTIVAGNVVSTDPAAGVVVDIGSEVDAVVSTGP